MQQSWHPLSIDCLMRHRALLAMEAEHFFALQGRAFGLLHAGKRTSKLPLSDT
jgi:hypothetical protein